MKTDDETLIEWLKAFLESLEDEVLAHSNYKYNTTMLTKAITRLEELTQQVDTLKSTIAQITWLDNAKQNDKPAKPMRSAEEWSLDVSSATYGCADPAGKEQIGIIKAIQQDALQSRIPDDMVMMPRELTENMIIDAGCFILKASPIESFSVKEIYKAMIEAWDKERK